MGGTTAKTSFVRDGEPHRSSEYEAGRIERFRRGSGLLVRVPTIDIVEIGAGGGSIARLDRSGVLLVGPESAGAAPGPACYARGGTQPTVTDADLLLGFLNPDYFLGGAMALDPALAKAAIERTVAQPLRIDATEAALAIFRAVNAQMAQALGVHAAERGINLHRLEMVAFGGAGPVHAFAVAEDLGIATVIVPPDAGVLSAIGCRAVPGAFETVATYKSVLATIDLTRLNRLIGDLRESAAVHARGGSTGEEVRYEHEVDVEYSGQRSALVVPFACGASIDSNTLDSDSRELRGRLPRALRPHRAWRCGGGRHVAGPRDGGRRRGGNVDHARGRRNAGERRRHRRRRAKSSSTARAAWPRASISAQRCDQEC